MILALPGDGIFGVPAFAEQLHRIVEDYGIDLRLGHALTAIEGEDQVAVFEADGRQVRIDYDMMHVVPPHRAPAWVAESGLGDAGGFVEVDPATLQHVRYPNVFALGDATPTPPATNTGAAIRRQAPGLVQNLRAQMAGRPLPARYDGYSACPITTARSKVLLAEFDYDLAVTPSVPLVDTVKPRRDMWLLKKYGLPALYWNLMLKGLA